MDWLLLALGVVSVLLTANALRPVRWPTTAALFSFLAGWVTGDLPLLQGLVQGALAAVLVGMGGLQSWPGWLGLALLVVSWAGLVRAHAIAHRAADAMEEALARAGVPAQPEVWLARRLLLPFPLAGHPRVKVRWNERVAKVGWWTQRADVFAPREPGEGRPVLVFAHGGGWVMSFREFQGVPLMMRLAERGWVCLRVNYRLSPIATFPDHLVDVKRAVAWARQNAARWGGDPDRFLGIHGNSAGAHLAALTALTPGDPRYQPGFEQVDTSVDACAPVYGPMDLVGEDNHWGPEFHWFMRWLVLKASPSRQPEVWREASPLHRIAPDAPPFFVVHGANDTLVPVAESHRFVAAMRQAGNRCDYAELPGGQHALDLFHSRRGVVAADGLARWFAHRLACSDAVGSEQGVSERPVVQAGS